MNTFVKIELELVKIKKISLSDYKSIEDIKCKYLGRNGILPILYLEISKIRNSKESSDTLIKFTQLRKILNIKIKELENQLKS